MLGSTPEKVELVEEASGEKKFPTLKVTIRKGTEIHEVEANAIMFAVGRQPNVKGLGLEEAGVQYDEAKGVKVSKTLKTSNSSIYAAGDCCSEYQFTHNSDVQARTVIYNSLLMSSQSIEDIALPWSTFTDPEIATVGMTEA